MSVVYQTIGAEGMRRLRLPELTATGRRHWIAIVLPTWAGGATVSPFAFAAGALILLLCAGGGIVVRYLTEERLGEG